MAIYAHLQKFSPGLQKIMRREQERRQKYSVTKYFKPGVFPVKQGEIIAYTGRSGIGYPHLHFELRKNENTPINPLLKNFNVKDSIAPHPKEMAVIPLMLGSQADGRFLAQTYKIIKVAPDSYRLQQPVQIWGTVGLAIDVYDRADGAANKFSVYEITLIMDDTVLFHSKYQFFSYDKTGQIYLDRNYRLLAHKGKKFFNLFVAPGNKLDFYRPFSPGNGILFTEGYAAQLTRETDALAGVSLANSNLINSDRFDQFYLNLTQQPYSLLKQGEHQAKIIMQDIRGNRSTVELILYVKEMPIPARQWFTFSEPFPTGGRSDAQYRWFRRNKISGWLPASAPDFSTELSATTGNGHSSPSSFEKTNSIPVYKAEKITDNAIPAYPVFITSGTEAEKIPNLKLKKFVRDPFTVFTLQSKTPILSPFRVRLINKKIGKKEIHFVARDLRHFSFSVPSFDIADDTTTIIIGHTQSTGEEPLLQQKFYLRRIDRKKSRTVISANGDFTLSVPAEASVQNIYATLEMINRKTFRVPIPGDSLAPVFHVTPTDVPFFKSVRLTFSLRNDIKNKQQIGIYSPNFTKRKWNFVGNSRNKKKSEIDAGVKYLGYFTLLRDSKPPKVQIISPRDKAILTEKRPVIKIRYRDNLSNIGGEDDFRLELDGKFCISELDPELHIIKFQPEQPLSQGRHKILFRIRDRAKNQTQTQITFTIKGSIP
ncbi:MAG TPA: M23 family metallopeptidase [Bacteroidetes bacterium]|nr:M23 family metallopeptidase [Bacteroidota bacterium]